MKPYFLFAVASILLWGNAFTQQCPKSSLIIQSAACDSPRNLRVDTITCSQLYVNWQGRQSQTYVVKAVSTEQATGKTSEAETSNCNCDKVGTCTALVPVKGGSNVTWSVQAVCTEQGATIYSAKADGPKVDVPLCGEAVDNKAQTLSVFPNPTDGDLVVVYNGPVTKETQFTIYDVSGKTVFVLRGDGVVRTKEGYRMNLHNLANGAYLLQVTNGAYTGKAKFVLIKN